MDEEKPTEKSANKGWMVWVCVAVLGVFLFISVMVNLFQGMALMVKDVTSQAGKGSDEYPDFERESSWGDPKGIPVVRIAIDGAIMRQSTGSLFMPQADKIELILNQIRAATRDKKVKAIILEVNSPGGGVTASDEIYAALLRFKKDDDTRRVVVYMKDLAASGGYYVAMAGDWLIAEPTSILGSIGVIMQTVNWSELAKKYGVKDTTIKSGANKDLLNPFQEVSEEQRAILQELVDSMYQRFSGLVAEGRSMDPEKLKIYADGRVFDSTKALELGFIDEIGYWEEVVAKTEGLLGGDVHIVRYERRGDFMSMLAGVETPVEINTGLQLPNPMQIGSPQLLYLWRP
ncbi:MAG: protease-4 [Kiritimatiellia bacterium]|jgi:protease-4